MAKTNLRIMKIEMPTGKAEEKSNFFGASVRGHLDKLAEWRALKANHKPNWGAFK